MELTTILAFSEETERGLKNGSLKLNGAVAVNSFNNQVFEWGKSTGKTPSKHNEKYLIGAAIGAGLLWIGQKIYRKITGALKAQPVEEVEDCD